MSRTTLVPPPKDGWDFFIAFAGPDEAVGEALYRRLGASAHVFFAPRTLRGGDRWAEACAKAVRQSRVVVVLLSPASGEAHWQRDEIHAAIENARSDSSRRVVPVYLEGMADHAQRPDGLRGFHALDVATLGVDGVSAALLELLGQSLPEYSRAEQVEMLERRLLDRERHRNNRDEIPPALNRDIDRLISEIMASGRAAAGSRMAGVKLEKPIGSGNFGTIWLSRHEETGEELATKVFHLDKLNEGIMVWRFRRSIRAMSLLAQHRDTPGNIARVHTVAEDGLSFSMDFMSGGNLERIATLGWSLEHKIDQLLRICTAVSFAHRVGVIHRDIKPANVVLDHNGEPVLTDFDIADIRFVTRLSVAKGGLGTPVFAAPEQLEEAENADERSDIYSLGRLLYFLLLERSPGYQVEQDPSLDNLAHCPQALVAVVRRATQWDPLRRYGSVEEMMRDLEAWQTGWAAFRAQVRRYARWARRNALLLTLFALVAGALAWQRVVAKREAESAERFRRLSSEQKDLIARMEDLTRQVERTQEEKDDLREEATRLQVELTALQARLDQAPVGTAEHREIAKMLSSKRTELGRLAERQKALDQDLASFKADLERIQWKAREVEQELEGESEGDRDPGADPGERREGAAGPPGLASDGEPRGGDTSRPGPDASPRPSAEPEAPVSFPPPTGRSLGLAYTALEDAGAPMRFVRLSRGSFTMGSPPDEDGRDPMEGPQHRVHLSSFAISEHEVTQAQWEAVLGENPSYHRERNRPVEQVSWCAAIHFANGLSEREGRKPQYRIETELDDPVRGCLEDVGRNVVWTRNGDGFRLPTEAEWEYAARAGTTTRFWSGDELSDLDRVAWYDGNAGGGTHPVGQKPPNPWGLYDMHGNVWEWVWDGYLEYSDEEQTDPSIIAYNRVYRGGSCRLTASMARSAYRNGGRPQEVHGAHGFRVVLP